MQQQLLTVPPYIVGGFFVLLVPTISWYLDHRQILIALSGPAVMAGYAIFLGTMDARVRYGAIFLTASSAFTLGAMANAQVSANVVSDSARSIAIGTNGKTRTLSSIDLANGSSHVRKYWRADCHMDISAVGCSAVSHW